MRRIRGRRDLRSRPRGEGSGLAVKVTVRAHEGGNVRGYGSGLAVTVTVTVRAHEDGNVRG